MGRRSTREVYGSVARLLHWTSAGLIVAMVILGVLMTRVDGGTVDELYQAHVGLGLLVSALTVVRAVWRVREDSPSPPPMAAWRRRLYVGNHRLLYAGMGALALTGIAILVSSGVGLNPASVTAEEVSDSRLSDAHFALALLYTGLFGMHIIGARAG